ncbi:MAG: NAD(P)/FAD-dependent oxidoreductase [Oscillospiraceae bacterium]|nr:NAD(P)/FAD-dependent oxidoreductase [Oscillospiraceae bacterium]
MNRKVIVIGGGIAGLSAGIYAQKCGFDVTILESHSIAGGNCTSWKRKGYLFEGGMHWLTGSAPNSPIHKLWRYTGALDDSVEIRYDEPFYEYNHEGTQIKVFRDVDKTERHWIDIAPQDEKEIRRLCGYMRKLKGLSMPVTDLRGVRVTKKSRPPLSLLFKGISAFGVMRKTSKVSRDEYVRRFSNEGLRAMICSFTAEESGIMPLVFTMGILAGGDGGFPEGGSLPFAKRMADTLTSLGGEIRYKTRADKVIVENGRAVGVMIGDARLDSDAVIITADTMQIDHLFATPPKAPWLDKMRAETLPTMNVLLSFGINADLSAYPHRYVWKLKEPIKLDTQTYEDMVMNNYAGDPVYSPEGKTALTIMLSGDTYDFWKRAKESGVYAEEKQKIADAVTAAITAQLPEIDGKVEVVDVATPLTYERYCANWKGSWMTEMKSGMNMKSYPAVIDELGGVYFAGHRMMPPGGLPIAVQSGRRAVQYLCRDTGTVFVSEA